MATCSNQNYQKILLCYILYPNNLSFNTER